MDQAKLSRIAVVARDLNLKRSTIISAIERGELRAYVTKCGLPLVRAEDVAEWDKQDRPLGRKPKADSR